MPADVSGNECTRRDHLLALTACVLERGDGERSAVPLPFGAVGHFGVQDLERCSAFAIRQLARAGGGGPSRRDPGFVSIVIERIDFVASAGE